MEDLIEGPWIHPREFHTVSLSRAPKMLADCGEDANCYDGDKQYSRFCKADIWLRIQVIRNANRSESVSGPCTPLLAPHVPPVLFFTLT